MATDHSLHPAKGTRTAGNTRQNIAMRAETWSKHGGRKEMVCSQPTFLTRTTGPATALYKLTFSHPDVYGSHQFLDLWHGCWAEMVAIIDERRWRQW
jgi:hypothetical protein